jgi:hypothetical protein
MNVQDYFQIKTWLSEAQMMSVENLLCIEFWQHIER